MIFYIMGGFLHWFFDFTLVQKIWDFTSVLEGFLHQFCNRYWCRRCKKSWFFTSVLEPI